MRAARAVGDVKGLLVSSTATLLLYSSATSDYSAVISAPTHQERLALQTLNTERERCGFPLLESDKHLSAAAQNHLRWLLRHQSNEHFQKAEQREEFTGVTVDARVRYAGYQKEHVAESVNEFYGPKTQLGPSSVRTLLAAPYHLRGMVAPYTDVGIAIHEGPAPPMGKPRWLAVIVMGAADNSLSPAIDEVRTYPCEGTKEANFEVLGEIPNPVPGRDLESYPIGTPLLVYGNPAQTLQIVSAQMTAESTGASVKLRDPVGEGNDPNGFLPGHVAYVAPDSSLAPDTRYRVELVVRVERNLLLRQFAFTTAPDADNR